MENGLYTVVELGDNEKWFVIAETEYEGDKYSYLVRVNDEENDFLDEYEVVKSYYDGDDEYFDIVTGKEILEKIIPILIPAAGELMENPEKLKEYLN